MKITNLTGRTFGEWTVLGYSHKDESTHWWHVRCSCGSERTVRQWSLTTGKSQRCGPCGSRAGADFLSRKQGEQWVGTETNGWVVLARAEPVERFSHTITMWVCRCLTCGAVVDIPRTNIHKPTMPTCRHGISPVTEE